MWKAIKERVCYTDLSETPFAFTEAPAEGIFSIYSSVIGGRESLTIDKSVALTRVALYGPPSATEDSAKLVKAAVQHYPSTYRERYCTVHWRQGTTSDTVNKVISKKWEW